MAATSFGDPNLVWQKVNQALGAGLGSGAAGSPVSQNAFRALKLQMATQKLNAPLQFVPFGEADVDIATSGFTGPTGAFTLYGIWAKKTGTGSTVSFLEVKNQINTTYGTGATGTLVSLRFKTVGDENFQIAPGGIPFSQTTGSTIVSTTTINGATSTAADSDSVHGFLIIGA